MKAKPLAVLLLWVGCGYGQTGDSGLYVKVRLDDKFKAPALKSGDVVEGALSQDIYSGDQELFPAGSRVRLVVDKLERRRRQPNGHWPWIVRLFAPRHENYPSFQTATITPPDGNDAALPVSLIAIGRMADVALGRGRVRGHSTSNTAGPEGTTDPAAKPASQNKSGRKRPEVLMTLEAVRSVAEEKGTPTAEHDTEVSALPIPVTLSAGTPAKVILLGGISASKNKSGDLFRARLIEPVRLGSRVVLPEGTIFQGQVVRSTPPRRLSRSGSLSLRFIGMTLRGGSVQPVVASVAGAELDAASHTTIDAEGRLRGSSGRTWTLINAGVSAGIGKVTDDGIQLVIEAISSTATDASTAGTGRIVALCASGVFLAVQHGRDVMLPRYTEIDITFDRPVTLLVSDVAPQKKLTAQEEAQVISSRTQGTIKTHSDRLAVLASPDCADCP
jgi:hypothetical protein